ncbi:hypothetical protein MDOR_37520 [Mycolicibacterium doricum]|uniref:Uncharacterized protein n=1 Tax=Mycolicibacterium doricum TaxID=126673 RepID=A0A7I7VZM5_9MYCO|nr:hypothetical protein MDOR_37520 [Mycolicibacterium doricum]
MWWEWFAANEKLEAYVHGVSTRSVDDLVTAMVTNSGVSKSEVDRRSAQVCGAVEMSCRSCCVPIMAAQIRAALDA